MDDSRIFAKGMEKQKLAQIGYIHVFYIFSVYIFTYPTCGTQVYVRARKRRVLHFR